MNYKKKIVNNLVYYLVCMYIIGLSLFSEEFKFKGISIFRYGFLAIIVGMYIIKLIFSKKSRVAFIDFCKNTLRNPLEIAIGAFFLLMIFSCVYSIEKGNAIKECIAFANYLLIFLLIILEVNSNKKVRGIIISLIISTVYPGILGIIQYLTGIGLDRNFVFKGTAVSNRITGGMGNPNIYGGFIIILIFPFIMLIFNTKNKKAKAIILSVVMLMFINMIMTFSRNAWSGFFIGLFVLAILYSKKFIYALGGIGFLGLIIPITRQRFIQFFDLTQNETRYKIWGCAVKIIKDNPLKGVGIGNFEAFFEKYTKIYSEYKCIDHPRYSTHNSYLKVMSELGILGFISFVVLIIYILNRTKYIIKNIPKYKNFYIGFYASTIAFICMNMIDNLFFRSRCVLYFWIILALGESIIRLHKKNEKRLD